MFQSDASPAAPASGTFLRTFSRALLLFAVVLTIGLLLSWWLLLPRFTRFSIGSRAMTPQEMATYEHTLRAELLSMEAERIRLVLPFQDPLFSLLKQEKQSMPAPEEVHRALRQAAARIRASDAVVIHTFAVDMATRRVRVTGDVRGVGAASMTVLAAFIEELERLPFLEALDRPTFTRLQDPVIGAYSPFHISFSVIPSSH